MPHRRVPALRALAPARIHVNTKQKYLGPLDEDKVETRHPLETLDEIYQHADEIRAAVQRYL